MKTIVISTHNQDKLKELRALTGSEFRLLTKQDLGLGDLDFEETGNSLEENALIKARGLVKAMKEAGMDADSCWVVADDTGLFVDHLLGRPGVYSARYAGEKASYADNVEKLLGEMKGVEERMASFVTTIAAIHDHRESLFEGVLEGEILSEPRGANGFGYDPIFYVPEMGKSLAEMTPEEKNSISHRHRAYEKFLESLDA